MSDNFNSFSEFGPYGQSESKTKERKALGYSFLLMTVALFISGFISFFVAASGLIYESSFTGIFYVSIFAELIVVMAANFALAKQNAKLAGILFVVYSICNGLVLSVIFVAYELASIGTIFVATALMFAGISVVAITTKKDLTILGTIGYMGLFALIIATFIGMLFGVDYAIFSIIGLALFIGITAYDVQKIKRYASSGDSIANIAIFGALNLYIDFVNIFLKLLRLFGNRK